MWSDFSRRDGLLLLGLLLLMFALAVASARQEAGDDAPPPLTSRSTASDGARALALWLGRLGYDVRQIEGLSFRLESEDRLLWVLAPQKAFSPGEVERVDNWVTRGGTLILTPGGWTAGPLLEHFGLDVGFLSQRVETAHPAQPLLLDPPWTEVRVRTDRYLETERDDVVPHLVAEGRPVALSFAHGEGRVFAVATPFPFTNAGLRDTGAARLVYNFVATVGLGGQVAFDEFHHGYQTPRTLMGWLRATPQGHSLIYAGLVFFVYLLIGGRRFGRPLSLPESTVRRAPVEHIQAMANLFRRGGKRAAILGHYRERLKRELAESFHLDPTLDDAEFVARLKGHRPDLDTVALSGLLKETRRNRVEEGELIHLAKEVYNWIEQTG